MHRYRVSVLWDRGQAAFTDGRYGRGHLWSFDGGATVSASSSPSSVPLPYSVAEAVDPEEALVAAAASCHMLWFLALAARKGYVVDRYADAAEGTLAPNAAGKLAFSSIVLHPQIAFAGERRPPAAELAALHDEAHTECFIANSLKATITVAVE